MFQNLRKKVNSVLPDIENIYISSTNSLSNASPPTSMKNHFGISMPTSSSTEVNNLPKINWPNSSLINFNAGCTLLERNEKTWEELHSSNEINAKKAEECDTIIIQLNDSINKRCIDLSDINVSLDMIPNILQTLENCSVAIIDINDKCAEVEKQLFELEDLMEILQLQEKQLDSKFEMAMFKERKLGLYILSNEIINFIQMKLSSYLANLEKVRQDLVSKHAETVRESEKQMRLVQQERQAVFQDAFQNDMNYYKEVGKIPSKCVYD